MLFATLSGKADSASADIKLLVEEYALEATPLPFPRVTCGEPKRCLQNKLRAESKEFQLGVVVASSTPLVTNFGNGSYCVPENTLSLLGRVTGGELSSVSLNLSRTQFEAIVGPFPKGESYVFNQLDISLTEVMLNEIKLPTVALMAEIRRSCSEFVASKNGRIVVATATGKIRLSLPSMAKAHIAAFNKIGFETEGAPDSKSLSLISTASYVFGYSTARLK